MSVVPIPSAPAGQVRRLGDKQAVAEKFGCSWRTVLRLADAGCIPWGFKIGSLRRWDLAELDAFIADGCKPVRTAGKGVR
jgi:hypothetical protein